MNPIPASKTFKGKDELMPFCKERAGKDWKVLYELLLPISFNRDYFNYTIKPLMAAAEKDKFLQESWDASSNNLKNTVIFPAIATHPRCIEIAKEMDITLEFSARVIYRAAFPQKIDFMTIQKLADSPKLISWLVNNSDVTEGHFKTAHADLTEKEAERIAAARLADEEAAKIAARLADEESAKIAAAINIAVKEVQAYAAAVEVERDNAINNTNAMFVGAYMAISGTVPMQYAGTGF